MLFNIFSSFDFNYSNLKILSVIYFPWILLFLSLNLFLFNYFPFSSFSIPSNLYYKLAWSNKLNIEKISFLYFSVVFMFLFYFNVLGLLPYVFSSTSHVIYTLMVSITIWLFIVIIGLITNINAFFSHFVPCGSPLILGLILVIIEFMSLIIRFLTLAIRLAVNVSTGHILLSLLFGSLLNSPILFLISISIGLLYILFELAIMYLQSYVFSLLLFQYVDESLSYWSY